MSKICRKFLEIGYPPQTGAPPEKRKRILNRWGGCAFQKFRPTFSAFLWGGRLGAKRFAHASDLRPSRCAVPLPVTFARGELFGVLIVAREFRPSILRVNFAPSFWVVVTSAPRIPPPVNFALIKFLFQNRPRNLLIINSSVTPMSYFQLFLIFFIGYSQIIPTFVLLRNTKDKHIMKTQILTPEQMSQCEGRKYNPQVWERNINDMLKYDNVVFYQASPDNIYPYHRYYCEYTLPEGLRLFKSFGYSSSITNGGFYRLDKDNITEDGKTMSDLLALISSGNMADAIALSSAIQESKIVEITMGKMFNEEGQDVVIGTTPQARQWMIEKSNKYGMTFTKSI